MEPVSAMDALQAAPMDAMGALPMDAMSVGPLDAMIPQGAAPGMADQVEPAVRAAVEAMQGIIIRDHMGREIINVPPGFDKLPIIAILSFFTFTALIVVAVLVYRYRRFKVAQESAAKSNAEVETLTEERDRLEARVKNLERIVTAVDLELQSRLERIADRQAALSATVMALPGATMAGDAGSAATVALQAPRGDLPSGSVLLERFEVERALGRGGMGAVYLAQDRQLGERVALKVITRELAEDGAAAERFRREAGAARKVTHSNVIRIHDLGSSDGMLFLTMEYFAGRSLAALLAQRHVLGLEEARPILDQVCDGLAAAHAAGVVHRDLKPQNVLVNERGEVRVIDFGLAKAGFLESMTATGLILGTPEYMAPEQVRGRPVDLRADLYALGAMAYHMVCGRPPFSADSPIAVGFLHCTEPPAPPRSLTPALPEPVEAAILRALAKDPAERFDSAQDFKTALRA